MTFLITGVCGLIGSRVAEWLLKNTDHSVIGIDDLSGGFLENLPNDNKNFIFYQKSIVDNKEIDKIFQETTPDFVYHFAAYAAVCVSPFIRCFNYTNNIVGTASIVNACIKYDVKRLVFSSSMDVYGQAIPPFEESIDCYPLDPYGVSKLACEMDIKIAGRQHGLDWCIIRPHNCYGRNQNIWDSYRNFIGISMYKGLIGDPITIYGDGKQTRAFSDIADCLEPLYNAAISKKASKEIINLGGIKQHSINYVADVVNDFFKTKIIYLPQRMEVTHAFATWQKSVDILGFEHKIPLEYGVSNMYEWVKVQPKKDRFIWENYEIEKGLYPQWQSESLKDGFYK